MGTLERLSAVRFVASSSPWLGANLDHLASRHGRAPGSEVEGSVVSSLRHRVFGLPLECPQATGRIRNAAESATPRVSPFLERPGERPERAGIASGQPRS